MTSWPFPSTVTPPSLTVKPRSRSATGSTPIENPSGTITFLSMIALRTTAPLPMVTLSSSTERSTLAPAET